MDANCHKSERELLLAHRLLACLHIDCRSVTSRAAPYPDVLAVAVNGQAFAIEVTEVHADDRASHGSKLAAQEKEVRKKNPLAHYALWHGKPEPLQAIAHRVESKAAKTYQTEPGEQRLLLLAANLAETHKMSTFLIPEFVDVKRLNEITNVTLLASGFDSTYLQFHLPAGLFEWTRAGGWSVIQEPKMFGDGNPILAMLRQR